MKRVVAVAVVLMVGCGARNGGGSGGRGSVIARQAADASGESRPASTATGADSAGFERPIGQR